MTVDCWLRKGGHGGTAPTDGWLLTPRTVNSEQSTANSEQRTRIYYSDEERI
ncbi:MAG: hypothetical protein WBA89_28330 [Microcoleus sp.]